jgi:prophage regulatory protein
MTETFLRLPAVNERTGFGRSHIYNLIKLGKFPKQIKLGPQSVAWLESEVSEWMEQRILESRGGVSPRGEESHSPHCNT